MTGPTPAPDELDETDEMAMALGCWAATQIAVTPATTVRTKAHQADLVTDLDRSIETFVRERLAARWPGHALVGEEFGRTGPADAELVWYCDPIDGTTNYANGIGWCSFSLCCWDELGPLAAVVADPFRREIFRAHRGRGAEVLRLVPVSRDDGVTLRPDAASARLLAAHPGTDLAGTVLTTEWLAHRPWPGMTATVAALAAAGCTVRIMGSSALSLIQAAAGRAAGCLIGTYSAIDDSAAALIAAEADAVVCDDTGRPTLDPSAGGVLVAGPGLVAPLLSAWQAGLAAG